MCIYAEKNMNFVMLIWLHHEKSSHIKALHQLTNGGDDCYGKVKRASKFPLSPSTMRLSLQHHSLDLAVVVLGEAVLLLHLVALLLQDAPAGVLRLGLQRVKHRGAHQQVREHAENERQGPNVLLLHSRLRHEKVGGGERRSYRWWYWFFSVHSTLVLQPVA